MAKNKKTTKKSSKKTVAKSTKKATKKTERKSKKVAASTATSSAPELKTPKQSINAIKENQTVPVQAAISKQPGFWNFDRMASILLALGLIFGFAWIGFDFIPNVVMDGDRDLQAEEEAQNDEPQPTDQATLDAEAENLSFEDQVLNFKTNFGDVKVDMLDEAAPRNVENIIRLVSRDYYDGLSFHRIVEQDSFRVVQGGDPQGDGRGGESAFGTEVEDEIFSTAPEFETVDGETILSNTPEFTSDLYSNFDAAGGRVTYQKGLMIMANRGADTNTSQFFITLDDTILAPQFTIVGQIEEESFGVLDEISNEIDPINQDGEVVEDGRPNKELRIDDVEIL